MADSSPDVAALIAQASQSIFFNRVLISGTVLVFYDYALTFATEISEIWNSKFSGARVLFFMTRYSFMFVVILNCATYFPRILSETLCRAVVHNATVWSILPQIGLYGILTLRTYAIYQKNQFILVILGSISVANVAITIYASAVANPEVDNTALGSICGSNPPSIFYRFQFASIILSLNLDVLVFTFTFAKTIRHAIEMKKVGLGNGLGYFILRDGAMYFLAKLLLGVVGTIAFFVPASGGIGNWLSVIAELNNPLSIVLINRLVLNLRRASHIQEGNAPSLGAIRTIQDPVFATNTILGNLGAQLHVGTEDDDEIEEIGVDDENEFVEGRRIVDCNEIVEESRESLYV